MNRAGLTPWILAAMLAAFSHPALAQDVTAAANAYSKAQKAELAGRHAEAAELYELADSIAPTPEALRSALRARVAAGQLATAAVHAEELLRRYPEDRESKKLAADTIAKANKKLGRLLVRCTPRPCLLTIDRAAAGTEPREEHLVYLEPGAHELQAVFGADVLDPRAIDSVAGKSEEVVFEAPPERPAAAPTPVTASRESPAPAPPAPEAPRDPGTRGGGLPPGFFFGGLVVTGVLGGVALWSGLDVLSAHDEYERAPTEQGFRDGQRRERRTNVLLAATGGAAIGTLVLLLVTDWSSGERRGSVPALVVGAGPGGAHVSWEAHF